LALQHFYSRVPARVSLYNKADGFDTFAHSEGLSREFIERELAAVCENKLGKANADDIRRGEMPRVYTQSCTRSGTLVQNCITYMSRDYTGERSAYLSHTLVFSEEEKSRILSTKKADTFNTSLFAADIDSFGVTSSDAVPVIDYPETEYVPAEDECGILSAIDKDLLRFFVYAVIYAVCGKGRNVCFRLPTGKTKLSEAAVMLYNELLSVFPYGMRSAVSFASYVTDPSQYSSYKLRGVSADFPESMVKCVFFDLQTGHCVGVQHDEVVANKTLVGFFCELLENKELRGEFLSFAENAANAVPTLRNLNMKTLDSLVFLFRCSSGMFTEQETLPNDTAVYDFLCAYDKYRAALSDEYRMQAYRCLLRYPQNHLAIPKNVFAKLVRLYPAEQRGAKRIVMNVVLELIHTDIMRDKLFTFIKNNYDAEDEDVKRIIIDDVCRVFYGGFLQNQILQFFSQQFETEPENSKSQIVEKLLLSIRTPAVQGKIVDFLSTNYNSLSESCKDSFYATFAEMLPECDALAAALVRLVNAHAEGESDHRRKQIAKILTEALEADGRRRERGLLPILVAEDGFCRDSAVSLAYGPWQKRKIRTDYAELLAALPISELTASLTQAYALAPDTDRARFIAEATELYRSRAESTTLAQWLGTAEKLLELPADVADAIIEGIVEEAVAEHAAEAFDAPDTTVLEGFVTFAAERRRVRDSAGYRAAERFDSMRRAIEKGDYVKADGCLALLVSEHGEALPQMAQLLRAVSHHGVAAEITASVMSTGKAGLGTVYRRLSTGTDADEAMSHLMSECTAMCAGTAYTTYITAADSGISEAVAAYLADHGKGAYHRLHSMVPSGTALAHAVDEAYHAARRNTGILGRLFGKK